MRIEVDSLGELSLPAEALYGIHTARALANFPFETETVAPDLIAAIAEVKRAAATVNGALGFLSDQQTAAIVAACEEVRRGLLPDASVLPALQGGAGTSTNMCVNEVVANRALQLLGYEPGQYGHCHPIEQVNLHQSTNDVYPTALRLVLIRRVRQLSERVAAVQGAFQKREQEFAAVVTIGRTQLEEAVPMTMGAQFGSFSQAFERDRWRCFKAEERVRMVNIGGTAIGTGITAPRDYILRVIEQLRADTGLPVGRSEYLLDATANQDDLVEFSATLLSLATNLQKIALDLRLLHHRGELRLKPLQAGSSIMPGKVNPVALEAVISAALTAKHQQALLAEAAAMGSLQINEYLPLMARALFAMLDRLGEAAVLLSSTVETLSVDERRCASLVDNSPTLVTAFVPHIGYDAAVNLLKQFEGRDGTLREFLVAELGEVLVAKVLKPLSLMALGYRRPKK